jgi:hypothetical protein
VKWSKGATSEDLANVLFIREVNAKNVAVTGGVIKEQEKVFRQQMSVTDFVHRSLYVFCSTK